MNWAVGNRTVVWVQQKHVWEAFGFWAHDAQHDTSNCRNVSQLSLKLINRGLVGDLGVKDATKRLWRKVGHGNARMYCCTVPGAVDADQSTDLSHSAREQA